jgi:hypothetical protein
MRLVWKAGLLVLLVGSAVADDSTGQAASQSQTDARAAVKKAADYNDLITQSPVDPKTPGVSNFVPYLLDELNHDSAMRAQIGDDLQDIESDGHNSDEVVSYSAPDMSFATYLEFKRSDLKIEFIGTKEGLFLYRATLGTQNGYHGGHADIRFKFLFKVKVEYYPIPKLYNVEVVGYPAYEGKNEVDHPGDN